MAYTKKAPFARRRHRRTYRRRTVRRARISRPTRMLVNHSRSIIANRYKTKLVYSEAYNTNTSAGLITWQQYRANSLFDPDLTGVGHQPMGFDQICPALYSTYVVTGVNVIIEGRFTSSNLDTAPVTGNLFLGCQPNPSVVVPTSVANANEQRTYITLVRSDQDTFKIKKYYDIGKVVGVGRRRILTSENYTGSSAANPAAGATISFGFCHQDPSIVISCRYSITLVYYVEFYGPSTMTSS